MCGISCVVHGVQKSPLPPSRASNVNGSRPTASHSELESQLLGSLELIKHRGPDAQGVWISPDNEVGTADAPESQSSRLVFFLIEHSAIVVDDSLAHCRLAINDLTPSASQPLHSTDNKVHAVVNGEIYDFDRLRQGLASVYKFETHSDSEVVLALYLRYGHPGLLQHLRGEFAVCIYDESKRQFIAVRDRYGIKPLFWTIFRGSLIVVAEIKALLAFGWEAEWDVQSIAEQGWNFDDRTMFKGVKKVKPGHYMTCSLDDGSIKSEQYWDIDFPDKYQVDNRSEADMIDGVRERMLEAVRLRLRADVPVGIYLSGGIDSSALAGMASHLVKTKNLHMGTNDASKRICCFSIAFDESSGYDESSIAERTADWLDVEFVKVAMDESALASEFEEATWHCEQVHSDLNYVGKFKLSEAVRDKGYKVVLTGEGADEIFAGYPVYLPDFLRERDYASSSKLLFDDEERERRCTEADRALTDYYKSIGGDNSTGSRNEKQHSLNNISTPASMCAFNFDCLSPWVSELYQQTPLITIAKALDSNVRKAIEEKWHPLHSTLYVWSKGHLVNLFLTCLGDRTEMAHSIEARPAFLGHKLTEYVNSLPPSVKIRYQPEKDDFVEKWIQREAAKPFITDELYRRKKHPYSAPVTYQKGGPLHCLIQRLCTKTNVDSLGFVDWENVHEMVEKAFGESDAKALRTCLLVAQFVVLSQKFSVKSASDGR